MNKKVKIIEPTKAKSSRDLTKKPKVCAYCRVSTSSEDQKESFKNQIEYYEKLLKNNPDYEFVGIFADEAKSGTTDDRPNFQRMINMAEKKEIDIIFTKSISRFSRNVVDLSRYCKKLKNLGVDVVFEEEHISLNSEVGTIMITILGSCAQIEVENTSDHVRIVLENKMKNGQLVGGTSILGYDYEDGKLKVNEEEAETVRYIYKRYLEGAGCRTISKELNCRGTKTKSKRKSTWQPSTIHAILRNEKYVGDIIQGKSYTVSAIDHIRKKNKGEKRLYKVEDNHEAIISREDFGKVQDVMKSRKMIDSDGETRGTSHNSMRSDFTSKIVCAYCGKSYVRRITHPKTKYQKVTWKCFTTCSKSRADCPNSKPVSEEYIKNAFVNQIKNLLEDQDSIVYLTEKQLETAIKRGNGKESTSKQIENCERKITQKEKKRSRLVEIYTDGDITKQEFLIEKDKINKEINDIKTYLDDLYKRLDKEKEVKKTRKQLLSLIQNGAIEGFNKELFDLLIDKITIGGKVFDLDAGKYIDNPTSLHFDFKLENLSTGLILKEIEDGVFRYTMDADYEKLSEKIKKSKKGTREMYTIDTNDGGFSD